MKPIPFAALLSTLAAAASLAACADRAPQVIAVPAPTDSAKPGSFIVQGTATLEVSPDCADFTMTILGNGSRPGDAASVVQTKQRELLAALAKLGVDTPDIKLSHLHLTPVYSPDYSWPATRIIGYHAAITVTATTRKFDQIGPIMEAGASAGASSMSSQFRRSDLPELKKRVRTMALAAAKDKASQTVTALGISLGRIVSVVESQGGTMWGSPYFPANTANVMQTANDSGQAGSPAALGGTLQPLTLDVTIGFELGARS